MTDFSDLPLHDFDPENDFCRFCGVLRYAVVDGLVIPQCGVRRDTSPQEPAK